MFSPLQSILINKRMPKGFKLESEENVLKAVETVKSALKKQKLSHRDLGTGRDAEESKRKRNNKMEFSEITSRDNSESSIKIKKKKSLRERKPTVYEDLGYIEKDKIKSAKNPILADIAKKCERVFQKIKKHSYAEFFMTAISADAPCLAQIEKNIKSFTYTNIYQFGLDLRKLWSYYFATYTNTPEVFQRICELSAYSEEVLKELDSIQEEKSDIQELSKKVQKLTKEIMEISSNKVSQASIPTNPKKFTKEISILDKPMTINEKNNLGNSIRNLTPEQLKGIVSILSDSMVIDPKLKFFEFDIETLSTRKLRELERYVKQCLKKPVTQQSKVPDNHKIIKKSHTQSTVELSENEKIAKLRNDLAMTSLHAQGIHDAQSTATSIQQQNLKPLGSQTLRNNDKKEDIRESKNILSESDESLSDSEESESESLSSLDLKKQNVGGK